MSQATKFDIYMYTVYILRFLLKRISKNLSLQKYEKIFVLFLKPKNLTLKRFL